MMMTIILPIAELQPLSFISWGGVIHQMLVRNLFYTYFTCL